MGDGLDFQAVREFGIALLIGALVGIEREKRKSEEDDIGIAGLRTFVLIGQAGAVSAWLSRQLATPWIFIAALGAVTVFTVAGYVAHARRRPDDIGLTTETAAIGTCLLGGMVVFGYAEIAVALAIITSAVLAFKQPLHGLVDRLGSQDLYAGVKLLIATFVVLPILPDRTIDPWGALNPYELWWLVILISTLSLAGYVAVRWLGPTTGTLLTGLSGGLVSSTAVTLAFARQSRDRDAGQTGRHLLAAGILVAWTVMFARIVATCAVVFAPLVPRLLITCGIMGAVALTSAAALHWQARRSDERGGAAFVSLHNPFSLSAAIRFALLFAAVLLLVALARRYGSEASLYVVSALAGLTDVDAITLSMASSAREGRSLEEAVTAILIAAMANTVVKTGLVCALGDATLRRPMLMAAAAIVGTGLVTLWLV